MPIIGSSSITPDDSVGPQGPTGATVGGVVGPTGPTGTTGPMGANGLHVVSSSHYFPYLNLTLSNGAEVSIDGLGGVTGSTGNVEGINLGDGVGIFKEVDGSTFWFKGITTDGSINLYLKDGAIVVSGDAQPQEGLISGMMDNRILYLTQNNTQTFSGLTFDNGIIDFNNYVKLDAEENIINIASITQVGQVVGITGGDCIDCGETAGNGKGIQLEVRHASVYKINTPIGIAGFTGEFNTDEVFGFSIVINGNDIWDWPTNVYFNENDAYFSCADDLINFISNDGGVSWNASFASRGYGVSDDECEGVDMFGSCCFVDDNNKRQCIEFVSKNICETYNQPSWSMNLSCQNACSDDVVGVCCSEGGNWGLFNGTGICVQGEGLAECNYFGGSFWDYYYYDVDGNLLDQPEEIICQEELCASPCEETVCCKSGVCVGDSIGSTSYGSISSNICNRVFNGISVPGRCDSVDCCNYTNINGACCHPDVEPPTCNTTSAFMCNDSGGIFMGPNTSCGSSSACGLLDLLFIMDASGSMTPEKISAAKEALISVINNIPPGDQLAAMFFNNSAEWFKYIPNGYDGGLTFTYNDVISAVSDIVEGQFFTHMEFALELCITELTLSDRVREGSYRPIIILSDGADTNPSYAIEKAEELKLIPGVEIFSIGFGQDADELFLKEIASSDDNYYYSPTNEDLEEIYLTIGEYITCDNDACCFNTSETGICCLNSVACNCCGGDDAHCCKNLNYLMCDRIGGFWKRGVCNEIDGCNCGNNQDCSTLPTNIGACCVVGDFSTTCLNNQSEEFCESIPGGFFQGILTTCIDGLCDSYNDEIGACCSSDAICYMQYEDECVGDGGTWNGADSCDNVTCCGSVIIGSCCWWDGSTSRCDEVTSCVCDDRNGNWNTDICANVACDITTISGACCNSSSCFCYPTTQQICESSQHEYQGDSVDCNTIMCCGGYGACCGPEGQCINGMNEIDCTLDGQGDWTFAGVGSICYETDCECASCRACCPFDGGDCQLLTQSDCNNLPGTFFNSEESCNNICDSSPSGSCCNMFDGTCVDSVELWGCIKGGGDWNMASCALRPSCLCNGCRACCFSNDTCEFLIPAECAASGGVYNNNTSCSDIECADLNPDDGACCRQFGWGGEYVYFQCDIFTEDDCETLGGRWHGANTSCDLGECGSCCIGNECIDKYLDYSCAEGGGIWYDTWCNHPELGQPMAECCEDPTCDNDGNCFCNYDLSACCLPHLDQMGEYTCAIVTQTQCQNNNGTWFTTIGGEFITDCVDIDNCGETGTEGACCYSDSDGNLDCHKVPWNECQCASCVWEKEADCTTACPTSTPVYRACCLPNKSCENTTWTQCNHVGGVYHENEICGADRPCIDADEMGSCCKPYKWLPVSIGDGVARYCHYTPYSVCVPGTNLPGSFRQGIFCEDLLGSCCDGDSNECDDNITENDCNHRFDQPTWLGCDKTCQGYTECNPDGPIGRCCIVDGDTPCLETTQEDCNTKGGSWEYDKFCDTSPCKFCCLQETGCEYLPPSEVCGASEYEVNACSKCYWKGRCCYQDEGVNGNACNMCSMEYAGECPPSNSTPIDGSVSWTVGTSIDEVTCTTDSGEFSPCWESMGGGACCNRTQGVCVDNVLQSECDGNQQEWLGCGSECVYDCLGPCCYADDGAGTCIMQFGTDCLVNGGIYHPGNDLTCENIVCGDGGFCQTSDSSCVTTDCENGSGNCCPSYQLNCTDLGGTWFLSQDFCVDNCNKYYKCCLDGTCYAPGVYTPTLCENEGGFVDRSQPPGTQCSAGDYCDEGICCYGEDNCDVQIKNTCQNGVWFPCDDTTDCGAFDCSTVCDGVVVIGACHDGFGCSIKSFLDCEENCETGNCSFTSGVCCEPKVTSDNKINYWAGSAMPTFIGTYSELCNSDDPSPYCKSHSFLIPQHNGSAPDDQVNYSCSDYMKRTDGSASLDGCLSADCLMSNCPTSVDGSPWLPLVEESIWTATDIDLDVCKPQLAQKGQPMWGHNTAEFWGDVWLADAVSTGPYIIDSPWDLKEPAEWNLEPGATYDGTGYQNTSIGTCCIKHNNNSVGGCSNGACGEIFDANDLPITEIVVPIQPSNEGLYPWSETIKWAGFGKPQIPNYSTIEEVDEYDNIYGGGWCFNVKSKQECFNLCSQMEGCNPTKEVASEHLGDITQFGMYEPDWVFIEPNREDCPSRYHNHTCNHIKYGAVAGPWPNTYNVQNKEGMETFRHRRHDDNLEPPLADCWRGVNYEGDCSHFSRFKYYLKDCIIDGGSNGQPGICTLDEILYQQKEDGDGQNYCVCDMCDWYTKYFRPIEAFNESKSASCQGHSNPDEGCGSDFTYPCAGWDNCPDGDPNSCSRGAILPDNVVCHSYRQDESSDYNLEIGLSCGDSTLKNLSSDINEINRLKNEFKAESVSEYVLLPSGKCEWMTCGTERCPYPPCP